MTPQIEWLLESEQPWVRKNVLTDLLEKPSDDREVRKAHRALLKDQLIKTLINDCKKWPNPPLKTHKDAKHPSHKFGLLGEFGISKNDPGIKQISNKILSSIDPNTSALQTSVLIPKVFGGTGEPVLTWMMCDAPILAHALLAFGFETDVRVEKAVDHIALTVRDNGFPCLGAQPKFKGPGKKDHPCPFSTLISLKTLSLSTKHHSSKPSRLGTEMLLSHWEKRGKERYYLFGIGTDFKKLKYPFVWYDILHVVDVLSRFPWTHHDKRFQEMYEKILSKSDKQGRYKPESVWMAFKGFDFAQKREPSPTLTFAIERIRRRISQSESSRT